MSDSNSSGSGNLLDRLTALVLNALRHQRFSNHGASRSKSTGALVLNALRHQRFSNCDHQKAYR
ncbi:MAG: hypothetical protein JO235_25530 [Chroococcidiopsidaceae cyanobacterium CP_BM_RX_35]|nr:hypothetical protein [Chroococcidiopsidaceae cyanobacterium CP_BM_RX_35]